MINQTCDLAVSSQLEKEMDHKPFARVKFSFYGGQKNGMMGLAGMNSVFLVEPCKQSTFSVNMI